MSLQAILLECPNCGAQLQITDDLDRFACAHCSTSILVHREGGAVSLRRMEAVLHQVRDSTEKTAAELAIARYEKELAEVQALYKELDSRNSSTVGMGVGIGGILLLIGASIAYVTSGESPFAYGILLAGLYGVWRGMAAANNSPASRLLPQMQQLRQRIEERRRIADG
jgi:DNA-directed RNA polymerase subunit RPC12/RpoP